MLQESIVLAWFNNPGKERGSMCLSKLKKQGHQLLAALGCSFLFSFSPTLNAFSAYSNDELDQLEKEFVEQINQSPAVLREPLANQYINHLAKRLAQ
ncbi:MAG: hypothetical protein ACOYKA_02230, partial [Legionellaceae bacterium]